MDLYEGYQNILEAFLTHIETSYTISTSEVLFLYTLGLVFLVASVSYFVALNQPAKKYVWRRSWVK